MVTHCLHTYGLCQDVVFRLIGHTTVTATRRDKL